MFLRIASLIIEAVLGVDNLGESLKKIGIFAAVCSVTLVFYLTVVLGLMLLIFTRRNPLRLYAIFLEPMLLAFASTSGAVCIHKSIDICENSLKLDKRVSQFAIPFYTAVI